MASSNNEKRAAFMQRIRVNPSSLNKTSKQTQFASNNKNSSSTNNTKGADVSRQRSLMGGRGNER